MNENRWGDIKTTLSGWLLHNLPLKALSVLLAGLLWHQVASQQTVQREVTVPVEFINMPLDLEIVNDYVRQVDVVVRSDRGGAVIEDRQLSAVVDLRMAKSGVEVIQLTADHISRSQGLEILRVNPPQIRLVLENTLTKIVKVEPLVEGEPAPGYQISGVRVVPAELVVSGPESEIQMVTTAVTEIVNIEGASATVTEQTFVELERPRLRVADSAEVSVIVLIEEERRQIKVAGIPVQVLPPEANVRLYDKTLELMGTVPLSFKGKLDPAKFQAVIDTEDLPTSNDSQQVAPRVSIPDEYLEIFRLESSKPAAVRVRKAG